MKISRLIKTTILTLTYLLLMNLNKIEAQNNIPLGTSTGPIGIGTITPANSLEVTKGDINVAPFGGVNYGYKIGTGAGSPYVLWHNGNIKNIFLGVGAGNNFPQNENVFCGYNAGTLTGSIAPVLLYDACHNSFYGHVAGANNLNGRQNCFFGDSAGYSNTDGYHNVFLGV